MGLPSFGDVWHKPRYRRLWPPYSGACAHAFSKASFPGAIVKPGFWSCTQAPKTALHKGNISWCIRQCFIMYVWFHMTYAMHVNYYKARPPPSPSPPKFLNPKIKVSLEGFLGKENLAGEIFTLIAMNERPSWWHNYNIDSLSPQILWIFNAKICVDSNAEKPAFNGHLQVPHHCKLNLWKNQLCTGQQEPTMTSHTLQSSANLSHSSRIKGL